MRAHVAAIKAALAPLGYPFHYVIAEAGATPPYVIVWSSAGSPGIDAPLCDLREDIDTLIGVTSVAGTPEGVLTVTARVRSALVPNGGPGRLAVPGRAAWLRLEDSRPVTVDRDATIADTNRHPATGVDMYRLVSTPI